MNRNFPTFPGMIFRARLGKDMQFIPWSEELEKPPEKTVEGRIPEKSGRVVVRNRRMDAAM